jgi:CheY-like chemotaxis protein
MGGSISVESQPGVGSTFSFTIKLVDAFFWFNDSPPPWRAAELNAVPLAPTPEAPFRVLLAEDNPVNTKLAVRLLENLGCRVTHAANGKLAFAAATTGEYDLVLMDMQMPEMDGVQATRLIRAWEAPLDRHVPIVALTANAMKSDADDCRAAGMDDVLTKPIERSLLGRIIEQRRHQRSTVESANRGQNLT